MRAIPPIDDLRNEIALSWAPGVRLAAIVLFIAAPWSFAAGQALVERSWNRDVIYFALIDRFFDGDPANDSVRLT